MITSRSATIRSDPSLPDIWLSRNLELDRVFTALDVREWRSRTDHGLAVAQHVHVLTEFDRLLVENLHRAGWGSGRGGIGVVGRLSCPSTLTALATRPAVLLQRWRTAGRQLRAVFDLSAGSRSDATDLLLLQHLDLYDDHATAVRAVAGRTMVIT